MTQNAATNDFKWRYLHLKWHYLSPQMALFAFLNGTTCLPKWRCEEL